MLAEKILIDTSVWIEYFRNRSISFSTKIDELLSQNIICIPKVIIAELIQGAKSKKEVSVIEGLIEAFNIIDQTEDTWINAAYLSSKLKKEGKNIHLMDCYIAVIAEENDCKILTLDLHFKEIEPILNIQLLNLTTS